MSTRKPTTLPPAGPACPGCQAQATKLKSLERLNKQQAKQIRDLQELLYKTEEELGRTHRTMHDLRQHCGKLRAEAERVQAETQELIQLVSQRRDAVSEAYRLAHQWRSEAVELRQHLAVYSVTLRLLEGELLTPNIYPN